MSKFKVWVPLINCIVLFFALGVIIYSCFLETASESVFDLPQTFWEPFLEKFANANNTDGVPYEAMQDNGEDFVNYFIQTTNIISICYQYHNGSANADDLQYAERLMQQMMTTYAKYGYFPRPEYKTAGYEYGWVSSMDAPTIMLASQMLYELTGADKYQKFIEELSEYILLPTSEHGFNYVQEDFVWPLEYARLSSSDETNMYVLNGSLVGYISMKAMNKIIQSPQLTKYLKKVEKSYKSKSFHCEKDSWTYYMSNPKTVIPIHYLIFEEKLFASAYVLGHDKYYLEEKLFREKLLADALHVEFYENEPGEYTYYMLRSSVPNEYQIDCYATKIEFLDWKKRIISDEINTLSGSMETKREKFYEGMFTTGKISKDGLKYYRVYSNNGSGWYMLFERRIESAMPRDSLNMSNVNLKAVKDAKLDDSKLILIPDESESREGDLVVDLSDSHDLGQFIYAVELENTSEKEIGIGLLLYDDEKRGVGRYYPTLLPGKNLVLFDSRGFTESDLLNNITSIWIRFYEGDFDDVEIKLGDIHAFSGYSELYPYVMNTEYKIHPQ